LTGRIVYVKNVPLLLGIAVFFSVLFPTVTSAQEINLLDLVKDSVEIKVPKKETKTWLDKVLFALTPKKYKYDKKYEYVYKQQPGAYLSRELKMNQSIQSIESEQNRSTKSDRLTYWDSVNQFVHLSPGDTFNKLSHIVYGFHPYWCGSAYKSYNFSLLSRIAYFSLQVDPSSGKFFTIHNWASSDMLSYAHRFGCMVDMCITNFGKDNNTTFLNNDKAQNTCISYILAILKRGGGDGINVDFEGISSADKIKFTEFIKKLSSALRNVNPIYKISLTIPAIDRENAYDVKALSDFVDLFILMGYDYYGKNSMIAGPSAPLFSGKLWQPGNISLSVNYYLGIGINPLKLLLGVPYFGKLWSTQSSYVPSSAKNFISAITYRNTRKYFQGKYPAAYDTVSFSKAFVFDDGAGWNQLWTDDEVTLSFKYDYVKKNGIAGIAIWALGYDNGYTELWKLLKDKFSYYNPNNKPSPQMEAAALPLLHDSFFINQDIDSLNMLDYILTLENELFTDTNFVMAEKDPFSLDEISRKEAFSRSLDKIYRSASFVVLILVIFSILGFLISLFDYKVRDYLFSQDLRKIFLIILIVLLLMIFLQICNILKPLVFVILFGMITGILLFAIVINVNKKRKSDRSEITP
jgi:spore germination protein YaaH